MSNSMAQKSKALVKEKWILSLPSTKPGPSLPPETIDIVHAFYEHGDIRCEYCLAEGFCISKTRG